MGHFDPAEHDRAVAGKGVDVEAHARSRAKPPGEPFLGAVEIGAGGELVERRIALDRRDRHPGGPKHAGLVGGRGALPAAIGLPQRAEAKGLRSLHPHQAGPIDRLSEGFAKPCQRVADGEDGRRPFEEFEGATSRSTTAAGQKGRAASWTSTASPLDRGEPGTNRIRALRAAVDEFADVEPVAAPPPPDPADPRRSRRVPIAPPDDRSATPPPSAAPACRRCARYCLGTPPPARSPVPAATISAVRDMRAAL